MPTELVRRFAQSVEELERGPYLPDRHAAAKALLDAIYIAPWQTAQERERAQSLVARLERVKRQSEAALRGVA